MLPIKSHVYLTTLVPLLCMYVLAALSRQSNANWNAFFYTNKRFSKEIKRSMQSFNDARLVIVDVDNISNSKSKVVCSVTGHSMLCM